MSSFSPRPAYERRVHKIQERFCYRYSIQPWIDMSKVNTYSFYSSTVFLL